MEFVLVSSASDAHRLEREIESFEKDIYIPSFPDDDEREPFSSILSRLGAESSPRTAIVLAFSNGSVAGGMVFDYYPECSSAELIYIAVSPGLRGRGLGDILLSEGTHRFLDSLEAGGMECRRMYFETENPFIESGDESMDKVSRLRFFARNSACRVPIRYFQPPLSEDSCWAENLFLCILPQFSDGKTDIPAGELKEFLRCFYRGLGISCTDSKFLEMMQGVDYATESDGNVDCHRFAEEPQFRLSRFSLVYHFLIEGEEDGAASEEDGEDPLFNSYECDLMNYSLQPLGRRPIRTRHVRLYKRIRLRLPRFYRYTSEGHHFYKVSAHRELCVRASLNCSVNSTHNIRIAHLVITAEGQDGGAFNELDCIKMITAFGSTQEKFSIPDRGELGVEEPESGRNWDSIADFVSSNFGGRRCRVLRNGITELDLAKVQDNSGRQLFKSFSEFRDSVALSSNPDENPWNMAFCGLILGIFDFTRMNSAEISDTIKPFAMRRDSFIVLCRGHLMKLKFDERSEDETANILISPYLLIPSAVLSINEIVLDRCESVLDAPLPGNTYYRKSMLLSERIRSVMSSMNTEYLQDVFHYPSEKEIMDEGTGQRGLGRRYAQLEKRLDKERMLMEEYKSKDQLGPDYFTNAMLAILALLQVTAPLFGKTVWLILTFVFAGIIGALSFIQVRRRLKL